MPATTPKPRGRRPKAEAAPDTAASTLATGTASWARATPPESASATDILESILLSVLETIVFARIFLKELLAERNEILAANIVSMRMRCLE